LHCFDVAQQLHALPRRCPVEVGAVRSRSHLVDLGEEPVRHRGDLAGSFGDYRQDQRRRAVATDVNDRDAGDVVPGHQSLAHDLGEDTARRAKPRDRVRARSFRVLQTGHPGPRPFAAGRGRSS